MAFNSQGIQINENDYIWLIPEPQSSGEWEVWKW